MRTEFLRHSIASTALAVFLLAPLLALPARPIAAQAIADLVVTLTPHHTKAKYGHTVAYTVTVINQGPDAALDVVLFTNMSDHLALVTTTCSQGSEEIDTCSFGTLDAGASATASVTTMVVHFPKGESRRGFFSATVTSATPDPNEDTNFTEVMTKIIGKPIR